MTQAPEYRLVPVEPTEAMIAAAAQTPGMRAIDASSSIMQARGYPLDPAAFEGGSPLAQAYRAMLAAAPLPAAPAADRAVSELIAKHAAMLPDNPYCYFELAYTRSTEWMAWICSKPSIDDPGRKVIANGQGATPDEACRAALTQAASTGGKS